MPLATALRAPRPNKRTLTPKYHDARRRAFELGWKVLDADGRSRPAGGVGYAAAGMDVPLDQIIAGDCCARLDAMPAGFADLVFADPPFNIGYLYHGYDDQKDVKDYLDFSRKWMTSVHRALKETGSFYLAIGDEFAADLCVIARRELGFTLRNWIVWHYTFGQQTRKKFAKSHTHILYFTKQKPDAEFGNVTFNADAVRVRSARQTTYDDPRANPKGKLPDDTWFLRPQEAGYVEAGYREFVGQWQGGVTEDATTPDFFDPTGDTWNVSRVCGTFKEREGWHGCQMPIGVLDRIVKVSSNPGDVVLDPFNGSGTTAVSAALLDRRYVGIDQSEAYVDFAKKRVAHALEQQAAAKAATDGGPNLRLIVGDAKRPSRNQTETDAFGRPRVARKTRKGA